jgi:adenosylhomocysteine nucleosidase
MTNQIPQTVGIGHWGRGDVNVGDVTFGGAPQPIADAVPEPASRKAAVAVITVLSEEMRAVVGVLQLLHGYRSRTLDAGSTAHEAFVETAEGRVDVAAVQTLRQGPNSAASAFEAVVREYRPLTVLLVGIAGGIGKDVQVGDVVISEQVITYDSRREAADGIHRRGQAQDVSKWLGHRLHDFGLVAPDRMTGPDGKVFRVWRGPVGSGGAVITDRKHEIRRWLNTVNEKVLAVETEAAGVAQAFHEFSRTADGPLGWLTIRGISDLADKRKGHSDHQRASDNAALVMRVLLPHLRPDGR